MRRLFLVIFTIFTFFTSTSPSLIKASNSTSDYIDLAFINHLVMNNEYTADYEYSRSSPIQILCFEENGNSLIQINKEIGETILFYENFKIKSLAICSDDIIKIIDITFPVNIDYIPVLIDIDEYLYICTADNIFCLNGRGEEKTISIISNYLKNFYYESTKLIPIKKTGKDVSTRSTSMISLPTRGQSPYFFGCWAACIASFDSYYNHKNTTTRDVVYITTNSYNQVTAKSVAQVCNYLKLYFDIISISRPVNSSFCSNMRTDLNTDKAYILLWQQTINDSVTGVSNIGYHFTILKGFTYYNGIYSYSIMDPYYNYSMTGATYTLTSTSSNSFPNNIYLYGGGTCILYNSLYFSYLITNNRRK